jgi:hypothetical protein
MSALLFWFIFLDLSAVSPRVRILTYASDLPGNQPCLRLS